MFLTCFSSFSRASDLAAVDTLHCSVGRTNYVFTNIERETIPFFDSARMVRTDPTYGRIEGSVGVQDYIETFGYKRLLFKLSPRLDAIQFELRVFKEPDVDGKFTATLLPRRAETTRSSKIYHRAALAGFQVPEVAKPRKSKAYPKLIRLE